MYDVMLDEAKMWLDKPLHSPQKLESTVPSPPAPLDDDEIDQILKMYDVMLDEAKMWLDKPPQPPQKLESSVPSPPAPVDDDSDDDEVDPVAYEKYYKQMIESGGFDVDYLYQPLGGGIVPLGVTSFETMFGKIGIHCYNIDHGTNLQFKTMKKVNGAKSSCINFYITLEAMDPVDNSLTTFQTALTDAFPMYEAQLRMYTNVCRIKPLVPGTEEDIKAWWDPHQDLEDCYKCDLPDWLHDDALTGKDKLQFYEVKEWEFEDSKWLYLYAEFALFSKWNINLDIYMPLEMKRVVVQTKEDVDSNMKLKSDNAIFYMSFNTCGDLKCKGIVRKTRDGIPEHMFLEARCWIE